MFDEFSARFATFQDFVADSTETALSDWLFLGLSTSDFRPIVLSEEPSAAIQLQRLFGLLDDTLQKKFKDSVLFAISKWSFQSNKPELLRGLAIFCAYLRIPEVIDFIRTFIQVQNIGYPGETEHVDLIGTLIAVVAGFAPLYKARRVLEELFDSPDIDYRFAGQLFIGLCICDPENYSVHVPRFLELIMRSPKNIRLDLIIAEFVRVVSLKTIAENFTRIDSSYRVPFMHYLIAEQWSPATVLFDERYGSLCLCADPMYEALGPEFRLDPQLFPIRESAESPRTQKREELARNYYSMLGAKLALYKGDVDYLETRFTGLLTAELVM